MAEALHLCIKISIQQILQAFRLIILPSFFPNRVWNGSKTPNTVAHC